MDLSRRSFIRWVLAAGATASGCPIPLRAGEPRPAGPAPQLGSESFAVCHQVRDGETLPLPAPDERRDVVIVGGGPSGLAAADELKGADFLLLEKEDRVGGNCRSESWEGVRFSTAAAWDYIPDELFGGLAKRWKFDWKPIAGEDSVCYDGVWVRNFWNGRADNPAIDKLPFSRSIREGFRQFLRDIDPIDLEANLELLDGQSFSDFLVGYPPELKAFWDAYGPSNWGARTEDTSAYLGIYAAREWYRYPHYSWEGGIGVATERVLESLPAAARKRLLTGAAVYRVRRQGKRALVSFFQDGKPRTVEAKAVVMATPKFITKMMVADLPEEQLDAMGQMRYAPFLVYNLCFDRRVYASGYDNWPIGAKHFTDFVQADWVTHADGGDPGRKQVLTVYAPKAESDRSLLLDDAGVLRMAQDAAAEVCALIPGSLERLREVRIHRRGHPMPMMTPGYYTKLQPAAREDLPPIYFGHSDALGEVPDFFYAALSGLEAARKAAKHL